MGRMQRQETPFHSRGFASCLRSRRGWKAERFYRDANPSEVQKRARSRYTSLEEATCSFGPEQRSQSLTTSCLFRKYMGRRNTQKRQGSVTHRSLLGRQKTQFHAILIGQLKRVWGSRPGLPPRKSTKATTLEDSSSCNPTHLQAECTPCICSTVSPLFCQH